MVAALGSNNIVFWDINSGQHLLTLTGHLNPVRALKLINNQLLASGGDDKMVRLWDISIGLNTLTLSGHTESISCLEYLTTGHLV